MGTTGESARQSVPDSVDVAIVGGGIVGTSTAFFLSRASDLDVLLVEKDSFASGSTGDSSAILRHHYGPQQQYSKMAKWGHEFYRNFADETGQEIAYERTPFVRYAKRGSETAEYARAGSEVLSSLDLPVSIYEDDIEERYPMFDFEEYDLVVCDETAAYSDGSDAANGFVRAASHDGVTVVSDTRVEAIDTEAGQVVGIETAGGYVSCPEVVSAAGPWTQELMATVDVEVPLSISREQVLILDPPQEYLDEYYDITPTISLPGGGHYMRPDFGDGILVATHHTTEEADPDWYDDTPDEETVLSLTSKLTELVPALADSGLRGRYCGVYSTTPDHDFVIDEAGPDGCYLAAGFSGHGFKHGPTIGKILADMVVDGGTDLVDVDFFSLDRFEDDPHGHGKPDDLA
jgi:glycine/D-amino acid oxidase-like deaminating enzyme